MARSTKRWLLCLAVLGAGTMQLNADTITKRGTNAAGDTCEVVVNRNADGSISTAGASSSSGGGAGSGGTVSSSSSAGGTSVHVQAGGGNVSSGTTTGSTRAGHSSGSSASTVTVNGCTVSVTSP